jgi:hypothetical protein
VHSYQLITSLIAISGHLLMGILINSPTSSSSFIILITIRRGSRAQGADRRE